MTERDIYTERDRGRERLYVSVCKFLCVVGGRSSDVVMVVVKKSEIICTEHVHSICYFKHLFKCLVYALESKMMRSLFSLHTYKHTHTHTHTHARARTHKAAQLNHD